MRCPFCQHTDNRVLDSRVAREGQAIRRRRLCARCNERFTTYEEVDLPYLDVIKRDGQTEPFDPGKLLRSVRLACKKRPVPGEELSDFVARLHSALKARPQAEVRSREIGDTVLAYLRERDPVAFVRYASVYQSFDTIEAFVHAVRDFEPAAESIALLASEPDETEAL